MKITLRRLLISTLILAAMYVAAGEMVIHKPDTTPEITASTPSDPASSTEQDHHQSDVRSRRTLSKAEDKISLDDSQQSFSDGQTTYPLRYYKPLQEANDPSARQWWTGQSGLEESWAIPSGSRQTTVAVIDSGFALEHEDLKERWATNQSEQGPTDQEAASVDNTLNCTDLRLPLDKSCNLIDDDNNGYIDDVTGWDFMNDDNSPQAGEVAPTGAGVAHGTNVSGILAATGNNNVGIAGVDWSTKVLPLQALGDAQDGTTITISRAIYYAVERDVDVINLSLGGDNEDPYLRQAIGYALDNDVVVVAASGNQGCDCISYPARYPEVVAVGAESQRGGPTSFSSYGDQLDILAPGEAMTSTTFTANNPTSAYASNLNGTSFSTPFVSGILSRQRAISTDASWGELIATLQAATDKTGLGNEYRTNLRGSGGARPAASLNRLITPLEYPTRYEFTMSETTHPLSSQRVYQCQAGSSGSSLLGILESNQQRRFTINLLERHRLLTQGWSLVKEFPVCVGLPNDTTTTRRIINLDSELFNQPKQTSSPMVNPILGKNLYVTPNTPVDRPVEITSQPSSLWLGSWINDVTKTAHAQVSDATRQNQLTTLVAYNIPQRDCGGYSSGGAESSAAYRTWIQKLVSGIGQREAIVILEPDALAQIDCLSTEQQSSRYSDLRYAVKVLSEQTKAYIYIDAGHGAWISAKTMAARLDKADISKAQGFSLNVANFETTLSNTNYGNQLSALVNNKHYVIDTSRNGRGPGNTWCNPSGRGLGIRPSTNTSGYIDAYLWIKRPGESDGLCNGGPGAGQWWQDYAEELVQNAS